MIYLIHFDKPYRHARHYLGFAGGKLETRLQRHKRGDGARLLQVLKQHGIEWSVVRVWPEGDRDLERKLKNKKNSKCLCPVCNPSIGEPFTSRKHVLQEFLISSISTRSSQESKIYFAGEEF